MVIGSYKFLFDVKFYLRLLVSNTLFLKVYNCRQRVLSDRFGTRTGIVSRTKKNEKITVLDSRETGRDPPLMTLRFWILNSRVGVGVFGNISKSFKPTRDSISKGRNGKQRVLAIKGKTVGPTTNNGSVFHNKWNTSYDNSSKIILVIIYQHDFAVILYTVILYIIAWQLAVEG